MAGRRRKIGKTRALALASLAFQAACGLCGNTDDVRVPSPDRKHVAHSYLYDCGATTGYTTHVDLEAPGYSRGANVYSAEGAYDITLRWDSSNELHIECRGCPPRHLTAPRIDGVTITVISAARDGVVVPRLSGVQSGSAAPTLVATTIGTTRDSRASHAHVGRPR